MKTAGKIASGILVLMALLSLFAPFITNVDPDEIDLDSLREPPNENHPFGTDNKGRDILARILYGGRISISIAVTAA
jgi:peptide/nickel transport system permease protein